MRSDWSIIEIENNIMFIEDLDLGRTSITNDAESVLDHIKDMYHKDMRVVYRDTNGQLDEIVSVDGVVQFKKWRGHVWDALVS